MNTIRWKVVHPKPELNSQSQHSKLKYQNISAEEDTSMYISWVLKTQTGISRLILKPQAGQPPPSPLQEWARNIPYPLSVIKLAIII